MPLTVTGKSHISLKQPFQDREGQPPLCYLLGAVISGALQASAVSDNFLPSVSLCGKSHFISFL